jgi:energy-coupling factor transporter ATP-binding protein EcfA2
VIRRPGPASELLARECERLAEREDLRGEQVLADTAAQCRQPLRVMIAGDVSAGKSTLINALLGTVIARTGRAETTARLTWYRHPGLSSDRNQAVDVRFPLADRIILLDSPGLNTTSQAQRATLGALSGREYDTGAAAVLVYLVISELSAQGYDRIADFAALGPDDLGNIVLVAGKAETVKELPAGDPARATETVEQAAGKTERRLRARRIPVRTVAVSQHLGMIARCGWVTAHHVHLVRGILGDAELRQFAAAGWHQLDKAWMARGRGKDELTPLRELFPSLNWLPAELPDVTGLDMAALTACCERVSRLRHLERILAELAEDADLLTATAARGRLLRWASSLGTIRARLIRERLDALWTGPAFAGFARRRAALLLSTSLMDHVPDADRATAIALLRGEPSPCSGVTWADAARHWQRRANPKLYGDQAAEVADIVAIAVSRQATRFQGRPCPNIS